MPKLNESDFLTVDFQTLLNNTPESNTDTNSPQSIAKNSIKPTKSSKVTNLDWDKELENRLSANRKMSNEARKNEYDIETQFFIEFFKAKFQPKSVKQLMLIGESLRKDFRVLGFSTNTNPILAFLSLKYVQEELLQTKLVNINTYKALHHAYTNRWLADSELFKVNDYNIIYCRDLYKKPLETIKEFLKLQSEGTIKPKSSVYKLEDQTNNKKIFLYTNKNTAIDMDERVSQQLSLNIKFPSMTNAAAVLNDFELAEKIVNKLKGKGSGNYGARTHKKNMGTRALGDFANKFGQDPAKILAFLQYFIMTTGNEKAKQALSHEKLQDISVDALRDATIQISEFVPQAKLSLDDAKVLIDVLLGNLD